MTQTEFLTSLGARIKELRTKKNISQKDLAMEWNFEKASMSRIESGKTNITILTLYKIISALDADVKDFFWYYSAAPGTTQAPVHVENFPQSGCCQL